MRLIARTAAMMTVLAVPIPIEIGPSAQGPGNGRAPYAVTGPIETPRLFGEGTISTGDAELNAAFAPDGKTLYYTKRTAKGAYWAILVSHYTKGAWDTPEIADFSGEYNDFDPFVSPDGSKIFFSSNRPVDDQAHSDFDIWVVDRQGRGTTGLRRLPAPINSDAQEYYPTVSAGGTVYFSSTRPGGLGRADIYRSKLVAGQYTEPENLGPMINSEFFEGDPYISADGSYLFFTSFGRPDGIGDGDIYVSYNRDGAWTKAVNLGREINSSVLDFCPIVSPDGKYFFFTSERGIADSPRQHRQHRLNYAEFIRQIRQPGNGLGDVYQVDLAKVMSLTQPH